MQPLVLSKKLIQKMRMIVGVMIIMVCVLDNNFASGDTENKTMDINSGHIVFYPKSEKLYDDGLMRRLYDAYNIMDPFGKTVLEVSPAWDYPFKIRLDAGLHFISYKDEHENSKSIPVFVESGLEKQVRMDFYSEWD
jgi:hypothetical protein